MVGRLHSHSVLKTLSIIGRCPMNMNIPDKKRVLQKGTQPQNGDILENG
jgi:hypothetical protein